MTPDLTISIANYNTRGHLKNCLESIFSSVGEGNIIKNIRKRSPQGKKTDILKNSKGLKIEIFVVDNASTDGSQKMIKQEFPQINLIENPKKFTRHGWRAYNQATQRAKGQFIVTMNSDILISKTTLSKMIQFLKSHPDAAAAAPRQVDKNEHLAFTCSRFPTPQIEFFESNLLAKIFKNKKLIDWYRYNGWQRNTVRKVDVISGSFFFADASKMQKVGWFDENFLLYYGENDLCLRIKKTGFHIYHNPHVTITHLQSESVKKLSSWELNKIVLNDMLYYYKKHFGIIWWLFLWFAYRPNWLYWKWRNIM